MQYQEKKYRVDSFSAVENKLSELGAKQSGKSASTHYYAPQTANGVIKLVVHGAKAEVHILEESNGKFSLKENISMKSKGAGLNWLRDRGYRSVGIVKMAHTDYGYKGGTVGLYLINGLLHSVILEFPEGEHEAVAQDLGLEATETVTVPYNKYLEQRNMLDIKPLAQGS